jgi:tRNA(fMet)-specific endonuclease VapC
VRYLLDANVVSEPLRPRPSKHVLEALDKAAGEIALPSIVWHELLYGAARLPESRRRDYLEKYFRDVLLPTTEIVPYDEEAAAWHAQERARLEAAGRRPAFADGQIAAIAVTRGAILVTRNVDDFAGFDGLRIENWFDEAITSRT